MGYFFVQWFLKCAIVPAAPYRLLLSFKQMLEFSVFDMGLAFIVYNSLQNHTWYLTEQWVIVCLIDEDCPDNERDAVAKALYNIPRNKSFPPGKPKLPIDFWPEDGRIPPLKSFVGPNPWLLPHL